MKKIFLIITLSFVFAFSAKADSIPNISKWYDCQEKLEKQKINNSNKLCSDKYAKKISKSYTKHTGNLNISWGGNGLFTYEPENISQYYVITKSVIDIWMLCKNKSMCSRQESSYIDYSVIEPGVKKEIFRKTIAEIKLPESMLDNLNWNEIDWGFSTTSYGFKIDY
jgi:hypothetical protein